MYIDFLLPVTNMCDILGLPREIEQPSKQGRSQGRANGGLAPPQISEIVTKMDKTRIKKLLFTYFSDKKFY